MATQRLSDVDKSFIISRFSAVLRRAGNNLTFPVPTKEEVREWVINCMPAHIRNPYLALRENAPGLVREGGWINYLTIHNDKGEQYELEFNGVTGWPNWKGIVTPEHEHYDEVWQWCHDFHTIENQVRRCEKYVDEAIDSCTSAGQIARIFPEDILRFLPHNTLQSLGDAERKSRIPRDFNIDPEMTELVANTMAIGSVCPESRDGVSVEVSKFIGLAASG